MLTGKVEEDYTAITMTVEEARRLESSRPRRHPGGDPVLPQSQNDAPLESMFASEES